MQLPGWATALVVLLVGVVFVLTFVLDQIPKLSSKAIKAIRSVRAVRDELRAKPPKELDGQ
jgi:Sec-independent protein translocase protein TatA